VGTPGAKGVAGGGVPIGVSEGTGVSVHCEIGDKATVGLLAIVEVGNRVGVIEGVTPVGRGVGVSPGPRVPVVVGIGMLLVG
jgi:hypothetical protein